MILDGFFFTQSFDYKQLSFNDIILKRVIVTDFSKRFQYKLILSTISNLLCGRIFIKIVRYMLIEKLFGSINHLAVGNNWLNNIYMNNCSIIM